MMTAIVSKEPISIKTSELDLDSHAKSMMSEGALIIRLGLSGIDSVEILANESETEAQLLELWTSVRSTLDATLVNLR